MSAGDVLHMIITDETGTAISVELYGASDPNNAEDVGYGELTDYDGNTYTTVVIGTQMWIIENLRVKHYADGTVIPEVTADASWTAQDGTAGKDGAWCYYNNDSANLADYGLLYNGWSVLNAKDLVYFERDGVQEIGWRVPTSIDLETLRDYLGGGIIAGGKIKEIGTTYWTTPNLGATNSSGLSLRGGGIRDTDGSFLYLKSNGLIWTSTEGSVSFDLYCGEAYYNTITFDAPYPAALVNSTGMSVRCVKSTSTAIPVTISVDSTPGFTISSEAGYAIIGNSTMRVTFMCDAFPTVGGGSFGIEVTDASSNVLLRIEANGSNLLGETGVFFDSDTMWPNYGDTLTLSRAIVTGDSLTVKVFGSVA